MASVNKVILLGNVGKDPEVKHTPNGKVVVSVSLATSETWGKGEDRQEKVEWHRITAWGKLAEIIGEYVKKGSQVYIEGRLQTRQWDDKDGNKRYTTEVVADRMQMVGGKRQQSQDTGDSVKDEDIPF